MNTNEIKQLIDLTIVENVAGDITATEVNNILTEMLGNEDIVPRAEYEEDMSKKVDVVIGKGLSQQDYTNEDKVKVDALPSAEELETALAGKVGAAVAITYAELKALRDSSNLIASQMYRITDYVTTTSQENTRAEGHLFDVVVLALTADTLSERAWAVKSDRDTDGYFANSNLAVWQIWYCLDNDADRFAWADAANGTGVIYRMIDEFNNDCPYDFKNVWCRRETTAKASFLKNNGGWYKGKLKRAVSLDTVIDSTTYYAWEPYDISGPPVYTIFYSLTEELALDSVMYTIASSVASESTSIVLDLIIPSREGLTFTDDLTGSSYSNVIGISSGKMNIPFIIFGNGCYNNTFGNDCHNITFGNGCYNNTFGNDCHNITFGDECKYNTFGNDCHNNTFGNYCYFITFGDSCFNNTFGDSCYNNTFGNECNNNTFGDECYSITFGNSCYFNTFGDYCSNNTFGNDCHNNTFGNECYSITFGNECNNNTFGDYCSNNTFGNYCNNIVFDIKCEKCYVESNVFYIRLRNNTEGSVAVRFQYIHSGISGTASNITEITPTVFDQSYQIEWGMNSSGELKHWVAADLVQ